MTFTVNRSVVGRKPLKIRRSGAPTPGDQLIHAGHSYWSGARVSLGGIYHGDQTIHFSTGETYQTLLTTNLFPFDGSSGSPVINIDDEVVETVISSTINGKMIVDDMSNPLCLIEDDGNNSQAQTTNGRVLDVASLIPRQEVLVTPLDSIKHVASIGGTLVQPITTYELRGGVGSNQYAVDPPLNIPPTGAPTLLSSIPPGDRFLSIVTPTPWTLTADISNVSSCGVWNYVYNVRDRYNLQNNYVRHRFEIGMEEYTISPQNGAQFLSFGWPISEELTYQVANVRPSPLTLQITTTDPNGNPSGWLRVNGQTSIMLALSPIGQSGDAAAITISAEQPLNNRHAAGELRISHLNPQCAINGEPIRQITFSHMTDRKIASEVASGNEISPPVGGSGYGEGQVVGLQFEGGAGYCVTDVNVKATIMRDGPTGYLAFPTAAERLRLRVKSPSGTHVTLWDMNTIPNASYFEDVELAAFNQMISAQTLLLDDQSTPPPSGSLALFNGEVVDGNWEVDFAMGPPTGTFILPLAAEIEIRATPCVP